MNKDIKELYAVLLNKLRIEYLELSDLGHTEQTNTRMNKIPEIIDNIQEELKEEV